jgi:hypothetical protein
MINYKTLLTVNFRHNYFSNLAFNGFEVAPLSGTGSYLLKRQLLLKKNAGSFNLVMNDDMTDIETKKKFLFSEQYTLQFSLTLTDQYLYNYTANLPENLPDSVFHFKNFSENNNNPALNNKLHLNDYVSSGDCVPLNEFKSLLKKPFAIISLHLFENMPDTYTINFEAKETYWKYILVSDYLRDLESPAISSTGQVEFSGPQTINLPDRSEALCFQSTTPILLSQQNLNKFQLIDQSPAGTGKYNVIKRTLPTPDVKRVSSFTAQDYSNSNYYSEMYIY